MRTVSQLPADAGRRIRRIRRSEEVAVTALARRLHFARTTIHDFENGTLRLRPPVAALLLAALGQQPDPDEWPPVVVKLVKSLTVEELRELCGFGAARPGSAT